MECRRVRRIPNACNPTSERSIPNSPIRVFRPIRVIRDSDSDTATTQDLVKKNKLEPQTTIAGDIAYRSLRQCPVSLVVRVNGISANELTEGFLKKREEREMRKNEK